MKSWWFFLLSKFITTIHKWCENIDEVDWICDLYEKNLFLKPKISNNNFIKYPPIPFKKKLQEEAFNLMLKWFQFASKVLKKGVAKGKKIRFHALLLFEFSFIGDRKFISHLKCVKFYLEQQMVTPTIKFYDKKSYYHHKNGIVKNEKLKVRARRSDKKERK